MTTCDLFEDEKGVEGTAYEDLRAIVDDRAPLDRVVRVLLRMAQDRAVVSMVDGIARAGIEDPFLAARRARAALTARLDRLARVQRSMGRSVETWGAVKGLVRAEASVESALALLLDMIQHPLPTPMEDHPALIQRMYGQQDADQRERLERQQLAAKGELDRARATAARAGAADDQARLLQLAGRLSR